MDQKNNIPADGRMLPLINDFYSVQGEGFHTGKPAYFIRIGGCDIGCEWCDTKTAWDPAVHQLTDINEIIKRAVKYPAKAIVVTGGEPLLYNLTPLCEGIKVYNVSTYLETSGTRPLSGKWDWICLSPKKNSPPAKKIYRRADELKVIICDEDDLNWAEEASINVRNSCKLFLQPEWSRFEKIIPLIIEYVKNNPVWQISLQVHKFMNIP